jgi:hypothetical protein
VSHETKVYYDHAFRRHAAARDLQDWSALNKELFNFHIASPQSRNVTVAQSASSVARPVFARRTPTQAEASGPENSPILCPSWNCWLCSSIFFSVSLSALVQFFPGVVHLIAALMPILLVWLRPRIVPCLGGLHFDGHRLIRAPNVAISSNRCLTTHVTSVWFISRSGIHRHSFLGIVFLTSLFRVTFHLRHRTPPVRRYRSIYPVFVSSPLALSSNSLLRHQSPPIRG